MEKRAFRMFLNPGQLAEYRRRHAAIWPELTALLKQAGIHDYSIHADPTDHSLFAVLWAEDPARITALADQPVMRKWWAAMADIMATEADNAPRIRDLDTVFHLR